MRKIDQGNIQYYGPIYAKRLGPEQVELQFNSHSDVLKVRDSIKLLDAEVVGICSLMTISENAMKTHPLKDSFIMLGHANKNIRDTWPLGVKRTKNDELDASVELFYQYNGRGLTCVEHLEPLIAKFFERTYIGTLTYVESSKGVVSSGTHYTATLLQK